MLVLSGVPTAPISPEPELSTRLVLALIVPAPLMVPAPFADIVTTPPETFLDIETEPPLAVLARVSTPVDVRFVPISSEWSVDTNKFASVAEEFTINVPAVLLEMFTVLGTFKLMIGEEVFIDAPTVPTFPELEIKLKLLVAPRDPELCVRFALLNVSETVPAEIAPFKLKVFAFGNVNVNEPALTAPKVTEDAF